MKSWKVALAAIPLSLFTACGSSNSAVSVALSGQLTTTDSLQLGRSLRAFNFTEGDYFRGAFRPALYAGAGQTISCITADVPPIVSSAAVSEDGTFSIDLGAVAGKALTCTILDADGEVYATFVYQNSSDKAMDGTPGTLDAVAFNGSQDLGLISVNEEAQRAVIDASALNALSLYSGDDVIDFGGAYTISGVDFELPSGYIDVCAAGSHESHDGPGCQGPEDGESLFLKRLNGVDATTGASSYGIMVWSSEAAYNSCGNRLGFTYQDGIDNANIDLSSSGVDEGAPVWTTSLGGHTIQDGWKDLSATANWNVSDCTPTTVAGRRGWKCTDGVNGTYNVGLSGGGCTQDGSPIEIRDWSEVTWGSCDSESLTGELTGFTTNTCSGTLDSHSISCENTSGTFHTADNSPGGTYDWNNSQLVAQGANCSSVPTDTDPHRLASLQCFSQAYWSLENSSESACFRSLRVNWSATDPDEFIDTSGPAKARNQHVLAKFKYTSAGTGTFRAEEVDYRGIQTGSNEWTDCKVFKVMTITIAKVSDTKYLAKFVQEAHLMDTKASCIAAESSLQIGGAKSLFYLNKN